nr:uncharacterized protein LOC117866976 isoform X2 [Setaria viridis]
MASSSASSDSTNPFAVGDYNFSTWRTFFNIAFCKFGLVDHIDGTIDACLMIDDAEWTQIDTCIVSWLYSMLSFNLLSAVIQSHDNAYTAWTAISSQFVNNIVQRAVQPRQAFHTLYQADISITECCGKIKVQVDKLHDVRSPLTNQDLVVNLLSGLNDKFTHCISTISSSRPPMTFLQARSVLL